jgi:formylglycine-generating enzyme required for sulfatase activity
VPPSPWLAITAVIASSILIPVATRAEEHAGPSGAPGVAAGPAPHCEEGISSARRGSAAAPSGPAAPAPVGTDSSAAAGMVWIPGGEFAMGSEQFPDARPVHRVAVDGFWMDVTEVTNTEFDAFVRATSYVTVAERTPQAADYPGAPPENLVAGSVVFSPPPKEVPLDDHYQWWRYQKGADWRHPEGPGSSIADRMDHPVVHVAYEDVLAYAKWAKKRLPTEAEWEFAARGGLDGKAYVWGDEFRPNGKFMANTFQGHFPDKNTGEDGFVGTSPVKAFPPNGYGLYGMAGNVWEWVTDWYRPDYYAKLAESGGVTRNPKGPDDSFDPLEPRAVKRVQKGGSFLCTDQYCSRYMPGGRGKGEPDTGTSHTGFRCVRDASG